MSAFTDIFCQLSAKVLFRLSLLYCENKLYGAALVRFIV